jgi:hypothetical protein
VKAAALFKGAFAAIFKGALYSGGPFLAISAPTGAILLFRPGVTQGGILEPLSLMFAPFIVAVCAVSAGFLAIGLPLTALLIWRNRALLRHLAVAGAFSGFAIMIAYSTHIGAGYASLVFAPLGAIGGGVAGRRWAEALAAETEQTT